MNKTVSDLLKLLPVRMVLPDKIGSERKKEGLTSISMSRDNVGDALNTQKETNYASHAESPNHDPEERKTRCRVKIQKTDRGRGTVDLRREKASFKSGMKRCNIIIPAYLHGKDSGRLPGLTSLAMTSGV